MFEPTGGKPNQRFACFYDFHGVKGVGWGGLITFICTTSHTWWYATVSLLALPHIHDATLLYVFLHCLTYMTLRYCNSSCTSAHIMMLRYCTSSCTSSHTWCYATPCLLALPHIHDATLLHVFLHFLTHMMLRYFTSSCTSSHTWCYATVSFLALPSHTSLFQKTAKVLNETVQSRWLSLAIEKNARRNVLKPAYFKKTAKKWRWFWKLMNAENIAKRKKKPKHSDTANMMNWIVCQNHAFRIQCLAYERQEQTKRGFSFAPGGMFDKPMQTTGKWMTKCHKARYGPKYQRLSQL